MPFKKDEVDPESIFKRLNIGQVVGIHDKEVVPTHDWQLILRGLTWISRIKAIFMVSCVKLQRK
jgi:hypothetical protein